MYLCTAGWLLAIHLCSFLKSIHKMAQFFLGVGCVRAHGHPAGKLHACMAMEQHLAACPIGLLHVDELLYGSLCELRYSRRDRIPAGDVKTRDVIAPLGAWLRRAPRRLGDA